HRVDEELALALGVRGRDIPSQAIDQLLDALRHLAGILHLQLQVDGAQELSRDRRSLLAGGRRRRRGFGLLRGGTGRPTTIRPDIAKRTRLRGVGVCRSVLRREPPPPWLLLPAPPRPQREARHSQN